MEYSIDVGPHLFGLGLLFVLVKYVLPIVFVAALAYFAWTQVREYLEPDSLIQPNYDLSQIKPLILIAAAGILILVVISVLGG